MRRRGTKIYLATEGSGIPLNIILGPGHAHESQFALLLLDGIGVQHHNGSMKRRRHAVLADNAYSGHVLNKYMKNIGKNKTISRKSNETVASDGRSLLDRKAYRNSNVVERCFGRLKDYRRIVTYCYAYLGQRRHTAIVQSGQSRGEHIFQIRMLSVRVKCD